MIASISGLPAFLLYVVVALALMGFYILVYTTATAHNEFELIKRDCVAAALSFGLSLLGFALPLSASIRNAQSVLDCIIWGLVALVVQIGVYWLVRALLPGLSDRIARGEIASALFLGAASLAAGAVNAAAMTY